MGFEHGPFLAQAGGTLLPNPLSWNRFATMVYFEQPVGVGFSYSSQPSDYQSLNDEVAASDNAAFLSAFFSISSNSRLSFSAISCLYLQAQ